MHAAFLKAIIENPDDLALRLIYADYIEERGDSDRAEFIRLQCGDIRTPREKLLLDWYWERWVQPIRNCIPRSTRNDIDFLYGFPFRITFRRQDDVAYLTAIQKIAPIREIDLDFDGSENVLLNRKRYYDVLFTDSDLLRGSSIRRLCIRTDAEIKRLERKFQELIKEKPSYRR